MSWFKKREKKAARSERPSDVAAELTPEKRIEIVRAYHRATRHDFHRSAAGPHGLDWETQPDPFRRYAGAELLRLTRFGSDNEGGPRYEDMFVRGRVEPRPVTLESISRFFFDSLALSAWKEFSGSRWALRVNPSSGNLHPTEGYLLCGEIAGLGGPLVAHYAPREHGLEVRTRVPEEVWESLVRDLPAGAMLVGLSSIHWREAWKYGERAFRYCQHDVGHAIGALSLAASCLGWRIELLDDLSSDDVRDLLGLPRAPDEESESPDCILALIPGSAKPVTRGLPEDGIRAFDELTWIGLPNVLSSDHVDWEAIETAALASSKPRTQAEHAAEHAEEPVTATEDGLVIESEDIAARTVIRSRRSAVAMNGRTGMHRDLFFKILWKTMPFAGQVPFDALPHRPRIHFGLFVHRVEGLEPGLYLLVRDPLEVDRVRAELKRDFHWSEPAGCPAGLPLFHLATGDVKSLASGVSCQQAIAGDGAFSLGMLADFVPTLDAHGAWFYPRLFWEAGLIGQVLYLEAEAVGLRATGIGCYFDEPVHQVFGIESEDLRSLYHFTLGGATEDTRLRNLPAYPDSP